MPAWKNCNRLFFCLLLNLLLSAVSRADFALTEVSATLSATHLTVSTRGKLSLSDHVKEAVANGIPLDIVIYLRLKRDRAWLWDPTVAEWKIRTRLRFHALSARYIVEFPAQHTSESHSSLAKALAAIGNTRSFNLPLPKNLEFNAKQYDSGQYYVTAKILLDIEALPIPLRPLAYTLPSWWLDSDWSSWSLHL